METPDGMVCATCHQPLNRYVRGRVTTYIHPLSTATDGHQPVPIPAAELETLATRCDFCGDDYPVWSITGGDVSAVALGQNDTLVQHYGQHWATCATCQHLIDQGDIDKLADRVTAALEDLGVPDAAAHVAQLHHSFLSRRRPGRTLLTTTRWPPTPIAARDLPRIRDRLARLYRGDDHLPGQMDRPTTRQEIAARLEQAKLYWVDNDFTDLTERAAAQLPDTPIDPDTLPAPDGLLIWTRPITGRQLAAASWTSSGDSRWQLVCYRSLGGGLHGVPLQKLREQVGWLVPTHATPLTTQATLPTGSPAAALAASWLLIAQQLAETIPARPDRSLAKAYTRTGRTPPEIRIVRIRPQPTPPPTRQQQPGGANSRGRLREREWVSEHWKQQPYGPGRSQRRLIYVAPYLRGPQDQPIRPTTTVRILGSLRRQTGPSAQTRPATQRTHRPPQ